ncbi:MAG: hypothetical protein JKY55_15275 [Aliivibrio sp.]|uniref:hypothetical protein n=1 Tax=Aliivibrio sp. TaxID=1872443 RepID=UPI001A3C9084|nr:hypothetical protein [Aliivibrio sp.]
MSRWVRFALLLFMPIATLFCAVGVYLHAYGKAPEETLLSAAQPLLFISFAASSYFSVKSVDVYRKARVDSTQWLIYIGIGWSMLSWLLNTAVVSLFLYFIYFDI